MSEGTPLVFRIRRFCLDDGPGIRSTVFFKGCPLACSWCHNPEGQSGAREIVVNEALCLRCGDCHGVCPGGPCTACGRCVEACSSGARSVCGVHYHVEELAECLLRDLPFFEASGGGVTLSGGEPTLGMDYTGELAKRLKRSGIHVALETCGHFPWERFRDQLLPFLDLVFFDLKLLDPVDHEEHTGVDNRLLLENLVRLQESRGPEVVVRTPLVPGITDRNENLQVIRAWLAEKGLHRHQVLPFNPCIPVLRSQGADSCRSTSITR